MTTGNRPSLALHYPSLGSITAKTLKTPQGIPAYVTFNNLRGGKVGGGGYLGTPYNPFQVEGAPSRGGKGERGGQLRVKGISLPIGFSQDQLENRNKLLQKIDETFKPIDQSADLAAGLDKFHQEALDILRSDRTKKAFDLASEPAALRDRYGKDSFGQSALAARRLVEAGVRFVTIGTGGWDTHGQNFTRLKTNLLPPVDRTLSALIEDLKQKGLLESTIVYCAGEFNRTPKINKNAGRDHWGRSLAVLIAGGGFKGGYAHGTTDAQGMVPAQMPCTPDDVCATMFHCLGSGRPPRAAEQHGPADPAVPRGQGDRETTGLSELAADKSSLALAVRTARANFFELPLDRTGRNAIVPLLRYGDPALKAEMESFQSQVKRGRNARSLPDRGAGGARGLPGWLGCPGPGTALHGCAGTPGGPARS